MFCLICSCYLLVVVGELVLMFDVCLACAFDVFVVLFLDFVDLISVDYLVFGCFVVLFCLLCWYTLIWVLLLLLFCF